MEEDHHTENEDLQTMDEEDHHWDQNFDTVTDDEEEDHPDRDENLHSTYDDEDGNMEASEYRFSAPMALIRNQLRAPGMTLTEWTAKTGEALSVSRARVREQVSRAGAEFNYSVYSITHPLHPERVEAAKEAKNQKILVAADKRTQREAKAHGSAAAKIAKAREGRIQTLEEGIH